MQPIPIPDEVIAGHGAQKVELAPPANWDGSNGREVHSVEAMKIGDDIYVLVEIEERDKEILPRTNCFYLGFHSGFVPVFSFRAADVVVGEQVPESTALVVEDNYELAQAAHDSWDRLGVTPNIKFIKELEHEIRFWGRDYRAIGSPGDFLIHDPITGTTELVPERYIKLFPPIWIKEVDEQEESSETQLPFDDGVPTKDLPEL
jgi:hypothetical protein